MEIKIEIPIELGNKIYSIEEGKIITREISAFKVDEFIVNRKAHHYIGITIEACYINSAYGKINFRPDALDKVYFTSKENLLKHITDQI